MGNQVVCHSRKDKQQEVYSAGFIVKVERECNDIQDTQRGYSAQCKITRHKRHKDKQKKSAVEDQR